MNETCPINNYKNSSEAKILIVDDSRVTLTIESDLMKKYCNNVTTASSGYEAVNLISEGCSYDIIFIDYMMPDMDGSETAAMIKELPQCKDTVLILLTASSHDSLSPKITENFTDFLEKPINLNELKKILLTYLPEYFITEPVLEKENTIEKNNFTVPDINIKNLDINKALENCGGSMDNYYSILSVSYYDGENKLNILKNLIENNDIRNYTIEVHALKTVAALIGDFKLSKMASEHEEAGRNFDYKFIDDNFDSLYEEYSSLLKSIKPVIEKENSSPQIMQTKSYNRSDLLSLLHKLDDSIDNFDLDLSRELLNEIFKYKLPLSSYYVLKSVRNYLNIFDYDNSQRLVKNIIDDLK